MPTVSVVIPTYNRARFLGRALRSVLGQTCQSFEILVIDDGSTDETAEVIARLRDPRLTLLRHSTNRGAQAARNTGIRAATGEYVGFLDSDDTWHPEKLQRQLAAFAAVGPEVGLVHAPCVTRRDEDSSPEPFEVPALRGRVYRDLLAGPGPLFPMMLVRRTCFDAVGLLDESIQSYQEWDTAIRLARQFEFEWVPVVLGTYYIHDHDSISRSWTRGAEGYLQIVHAHRDEIIAHCGMRVLSRHYAAAASSYARGGAMDQARIWYRRALAADAFNQAAVLGYALTGLSPERYLRLRGAAKTAKRLVTTLSRRRLH